MSHGTRRRKIVHVTMVVITYTTKLKEECVLYNCIITIQTEYYYNLLEHCGVSDVTML